MKVFITGGTGFVGTAVTSELLAEGYEVTGLARSEASANKLKERGVTPLLGSLTDLNSLKKGAKEADAILHLAFGHDFRHFLKAAKNDREAIKTIAEAIKGTNKPFVITSGVTSIYGKNQKGLEQEVPDTNFITGLRVRSEKLLLSYTQQGVKAMVMRLPPAVHGEGDRAFTWNLIQYAKKNKEVNYIGKGMNTWAAVSRLDAAHLYRLALERGKAGSIYHAVAEVTPVKQIAAAISQKMNLPLVSVGNLKGIQKLSMFSMTVASNTPANSEWTQKELGWNPTHPNLLSDLKQDFYYTD